MKIGVFWIGFPLLLTVLSQLFRHTALAWFNFVLACMAAAVAGIPIPAVHSEQALNSAFHFRSFLERLEVVPSILCPGRLVVSRVNRSLLAVAYRLKECTVDT